MQSREEEEAAIKAAREKEALAKAETDGVTLTAGVEEAMVGVHPSEKEVRDADSAEEGAAEAEALSAVNAVPNPAAVGGADAEATLEKQNHV